MEIHPKNREIKKALMIFLANSFLIFLVLMFILFGMAPGTLAASVAILVIGYGLACFIVFKRVLKKINDKYNKLEG